MSVRKSSSVPVGDSPTADGECQEGYYRRSGVAIGLELRQPDHDTPNQHYDHHYPAEGCCLKFKLFETGKCELHPEADGNEPQYEQSLPSETRWKPAGAPGTRGVHRISQGRRVEGRGPTNHLDSSGRRSRRHRPPT